MKSTRYLNVPFDLSDVLFICTANTLDSIPAPLLNRIEVIPFSGYTETEKYHIAEKHLLPKAEENAGIAPGHIRIPEDAMRAIIADYTMEAGVRGLKKMLDTLCRTAAVRLVQGKTETLLVTKEELRDYLDRKPIRHTVAEESQWPGVVSPIGGLPEKLMAAKRAGISKVFIPAENEADLTDVAQEIRDSLAIVPVSTVTEVLKQTQLGEYAPAE